MNSGLVIDYCNCSSDPDPAAVKKCMQKADGSCFLSGLRIAASMSPDPDEPCCNINDGSRVRVYILLWIADSVLKSLYEGPERWG